MKQRSFVYRRSLDRVELSRCLIVCKVLTIMVINDEMDSVFNVTPCNSLFNHIIETKLT